MSEKKPTVKQYTKEVPGFDAVCGILHAEKGYCLEWVCVTGWPRKEFGGLHNSEDSAIEEAIAFCRSLHPTGTE